MQITVFRDLAAIRFVRCITPIPGASINAGGAGFTFPQAMVRCESELFERSFELNELRSTGIRPLGIAAHFNKEVARTKALHEAIETLCIKQIQVENAFRCIFTFRFRHFSVGLARTSEGFLCIVKGVVRDQAVAAHSAAPGLIGSVLKAWEEYRSMYFFQPSKAALKSYTKANMLFSEAQLQALSFSFEPKFVYRPAISALSDETVERAGRTIVYFIDKGSSA